MTVKEFVDTVQKRLGGEPGVFEEVCQQAKRGEMGFGNTPGDWGTPDGKG